MRPRGSKGPPPPASAAGVAAAPAAVSAAQKVPAAKVPTHMAWFISIALGAAIVAAISWAWDAGKTDGMRPPVQQPPQPMNAAGAAMKAHEANAAFKAHIVANPGLDIFNVMDCGCAVEQPDGSSIPNGCMYHASFYSMSTSEKRRLGVSTVAEWRQRVVAHLREPSLARIALGASLTHHAAAVGVDTGDVVAMQQLMDDYVDLAAGIVPPSKRGSSSGGGGDSGPILAPLAGHVELLAIHELTGRGVSILHPAPDGSHLQERVLAEPTWNYGDPADVAAATAAREATLPGTALFGGDVMAEWGRGPAFVRLYIAGMHYYAVAGPMPFGQLGFVWPQGPPPEGRYVLLDGALPGLTKPRPAWAPQDEQQEQAASSLLSTSTPSAALTGDAMVVDAIMTGNYILRVYATGDAEYLDASAAQPHSLVPMLLVLQIPLNELRLVRGIAAAGGSAAGGSGGTGKSGTETLWGPTLQALAAEMSPLLAAMAQQYEVPFMDVFVYDPLPLADRLALLPSPVPTPGQDAAAAAAAAIADTPPQLPQQQPVDDAADGQASGSQQQQEAFAAEDQPKCDNKCAARNRGKWRQIVRRRLKRLVVTGLSQRAHLVFAGRGIRKHFDALLAQVEHGDDAAGADGSDGGATGGEAGAMAASCEDGTCASDVPRNDYVPVDLADFFGITGALFTNLTGIGANGAVAVTGGGEGDDASGSSGGGDLLSVRLSEGRQRFIFEREHPHRVPSAAAAVAYMVITAGMLGVDEEPSLDVLYHTDAMASLARAAWDERPAVLKATHLTPRAVRERLIADVGADVGAVAFAMLAMRATAHARSLWRGGLTGEFDADASLVLGAAASATGCLSEAAANVANNWAAETDAAAGAVVAAAEDALATGGVSDVDGVGVAVAVDEEADAVMGVDAMEIDDDIAIDGEGEDDATAVHAGVNRLLG